MGINKVPDMFGHRHPVDVAAGLNFTSYISGDVLRPMLECVEGDDPDRVVKLAGNKIGDDGFELGMLDFGFAVNAALPAEAVDDEVDGLIRAVRHGRWLSYR